MKTEIIYDVINIDIVYEIDKNGKIIIDKENILNNLEGILTDIENKDN